MSGFVVIIGVAGGVGLGVLLSIRATSSGGGKSPVQMPHFATVEDHNLLRQRFTLPADIEGDYAVITIACEQRQQSVATTQTLIASPNFHHRAFSDGKRVKGNIRYA